MREVEAALTSSAQESNPISSLFLDILTVFTISKADSMFSRSLLEGLGRYADRPWFSLKNGRELTERWLSDCLREYDVRPRYVRIGEAVARGYLLSDFTQAFRRYISESDVEELRAGVVNGEE